MAVDSGDGMARNPEEQEHQIGSQESTVDEALSKAGTGRFQWFALHVCGLANAADAIEILSMSLVLPAAEEELGLTPGSRAALSTSIFIGMMLGGGAWGLFGDILGRRTPLVAALLISGIFGALSSQANGPGTLALLRCIAGVGVGGTVPTAFTYMAEVVAPAERGRFMVMLAAHWMVGSIASALLGWLIIPTAGWRAFLGVVSLPSMFGAVEALWLPESPRQRWVQGRRDEAAAILRRIASWNRAACEFPWDPSPLHPVAHAEYQLEAASSPPLQHATVAWRLRTRAAEVWQQLSALLRPERRRITAAMAVAWFGLSGGWYGLLLWFPEYMKRRQHSGGLRPDDAGDEVQVYLSMLLVALANLPGNIASFYLVDKIGRRKTLAAAMGGGAVFVTFFAFLPVDGTKATTVMGTVAVMAFNGISVAGWNSLDLITPELYPTVLRCTAMGVLGMIGRVGSVVGNAQASWLIDLASWAPLLVSAAFLMAGTMAVLSLPETAGKQLGTSEDPASLCLSSFREFPVCSSEVTREGGDSCLSTASHRRVGTGYQDDEDEGNKLLPHNQGTEVSRA